MRSLIKISAVLAAALLLAAPRCGAQSFGAAADAAAVRGQVPGGLYGGFSQDWLSPVQGVLSETGVLGGLEASPLPGLQALDLSLPESHSALAPLVHHLSESLGYSPAGFVSLSLDEKREVLALAADEAASELETAAIALGGSQGKALNDPLSLPGHVRSLEALRTHYAPYLSERTRKYLDDSYGVARRRLSEMREQGLLASAGETAEALAGAAQGPELVVTRNFEGDSSGWGRQEWGRLERELDKVRAMIASGEPLRGEQGNIKFLSGPLSGMGEIKFGPRRTHRVFFRYLPRTGKIALIRYLPREHMNSSRAVPEMALFLDDAVLERSLAPAPDQVVPFMHKLEESELSALQPLR